MRILQLLFAVGFIGWCIYGGIYLPAKYGAYGNNLEVEVPTNSYASDSVGEDNVGESLGD